MKAIETTWRGWRFRSRTEARWAVALTVAGKRFEYEAQGYALPSGWYLPDFWLPEEKTWIEVKGVGPTPREVALAGELAAATKAIVLIAVGSPDPAVRYLTVVEPDGRADLETLFELPDVAYAAARAERFDGRPAPPTRAEKRRWW
jgi:hypothetical protein